MNATRMSMATVLVGLLLAGCVGSDQEELQQWMAEQRAQTKPKVTPIPEPKEFVPQAYLQEAEVEPFSMQKLTRALYREAAQATGSSALVAPELARRKEPLESFPLDAMVMVGFLKKATGPVALVKVDNLLYQVRPGAYLGQNYGKVVRISEDEVTLREIAQDAAGEWVERAASLQRQEGSK